MSHSLTRRIEERLGAIERAGLRRELRPPTGIDLSSNDYLGLARHPEIAARMAEAVLRFGAGSTGSRLLRGHRDAFANVERRFARFKGTEASLYFATGYAANLGVLTTFPEEGDVVFSDELNHASLIDGLRLSKARRVIYPHNDAAALRGLMERERGRQQFIVTESLFSMDGDLAPLSELASLAREHDAALIVDEAHAVGAFGPGLAAGAFLTINTAGKALGVSGAFVAGSAAAIELLVQRARSFIFSTAPVPCVAEALEAALEVIEREPERRAKLLAKSRLLRERLGVPGAVTQIIPVVIGGNEAAMAVAEALQAEGFDVRAVRPPTVPEGTARLRVSVNVGVDEADLIRFADAVQDKVIDGTLRHRH